jgi:AcrR family transcriptional regulator
LQTDVNKRIEKGQGTRQGIVATAANLFARGGYEQTSIESILKACNISRGALYHHFSSKEALFQAVFEATEASSSQTMLKAARGITDPVQALRTGCDAWLKLAQRDDIRQIVLIDAPAVLGWQKWREIDAHYSFGLLKAPLLAASNSGRIPKDLVEPFAHILFAGLIEVALMIARAQDGAAAARIARLAVQELLERLLGPDSLGDRLNDGQ